MNEKNNSDRRVCKVTFAILWGWENMRRMKGIRKTGRRRMLCSCTHAPSVAARIGAPAPNTCYQQEAGGQRLAARIEAPALSTRCQSR